MLLQTQQATGNSPLRFRVREEIENPYQRSDKEVMRVDGLTQEKKKVSRRVKPRRKLREMPVPIGG